MHIRQMDELTQRLRTTIDGMLQPQVAQPF
jgi:hypothetical protein